jgi:thymidylate synthase
MNTLDNQYQALLERVLEYGTQKNDRTGTGTLSVFGGQFIHDMSDGFPLLTTKKMAIKTMMTELKWFLKGDTNIKYLVDNGCNIWNGDAYKNYRNKFEPAPYQFTPDTMEEFINKIKTDDEFAEKWGELGPIYGKQWRSWKSIDTNWEYQEDWLSTNVDQISNLINDLKNNPDSRRLMVSAWNVGELDGMTLPPCHYGFQVYTRELSDKERYDIWFNNNYETGMERYFDPNNLPDFDNDYYEQTPTRAISLMWNQRSVDTFLGLPFNIASYATLLLLLCEETGYQPGMLIGNLGDIHIYNNHIEQVNEQIQRSSFPLPTIELSNVDILNGEFDYEVKGYESHPSIKAPLSN